MSLKLARYKNECGYVITLPNTPLVHFKTNSELLKVHITDLKDGKDLIPIPFYKDKELKILKKYNNGTFSAKFKGTMNKPDRINLGDITWFILDGSKWTEEKRENVKNNYGLRNLKYLEVLRNIN